jgi:hypothetical protein
MEILQLLISFLVKEYGKDFAPLFDHLKENNFDIKSAIKNIDVSALLPLIEKFINLKDAKNRPFETQERDIQGLKPISNIADKDIVYTLNRYFYSN